MEKRALPFTSTDFSSSLSSSESLASARRKSPIRKLGFPGEFYDIFVEIFVILILKIWVFLFNGLLHLISFLARDLCHGCSTKLASTLSNQVVFWFFIPSHHFYKKLVFFSAFKECLKKNCYVGEDGGEKYNWERYAERFTKHL
ncbi:uncharacterized protein [Malus domestica]|uniref:uncharacterized protein isoform X1 n=1 Tax=Malus domestica TaxID=3750 RepID=UPI003974ADD4